MRDLWKRIRSNRFLKKRHEDRRSSVLHQEQGQKTPYHAQTFKSTLRNSSGDSIRFKTSNSPQVHPMPQERCSPATVSDNHSICITCYITKYRQRLSEVKHLRESTRFSFLGIALIATALVPAPHMHVHPDP